MGDKCILNHWGEDRKCEVCGTKLGALYDVHPNRCMECIFK